MAIQLEGVGQELRIILLYILIYGDPIRRSRARAPYDSTITLDTFQFNKKEKDMSSVLFYYTF